MGKQSRARHAEKFANVGTQRGDHRWRSDAVVIAYLHPSDSVGARFHKSLLDLLVRDAYASTHAVLGTIDMSSGANITTARNTVVRDFLLTDAAWLWIVDADMAYPADTLDRLLDSADVDERPIVGGLCFRVTQTNDGPVSLTPTIYGMNDDTPPRTVVYHDYPPQAMCQVAATGAACLLVHRRVFETMRDSGKFQAPWTWFAETLYPEYNDVLSEDITFCLRAGACGFPVFVDTSIEIGHQKTFVATADMFRALQPRRAADEVPTFVVIAGRDRHVMTGDLLRDLEGQGAHVLLYDNGSTPQYADTFSGRDVEIIEAADMRLHEMWADGMRRAREQSGGVCNIAILNNDLRVGPDFLRHLALGLRGRDDVWISYPDIRGEVPFGRVVPTISEGQTLTGYAFMVRGESSLDFDTDFDWWYGDFDLEMQARAAEKYVVAVGGVRIEHLEPTLSTRGERLAQAHKDELRFADKWKLDPRVLFLARNPGWGEGE
jgi:GT2 family glycosyltransferase